MSDTINNSIYKLSFNKGLYPKEAVLKSAYRFIDKCYIYLDLVDGNYIIEFTPKEIELPQQLLDEFKNEVLAQTVRLLVYKQTHVIRELLMGRAMASTMIEQLPHYADSEITESDNNLDEILTDWFDKHEHE